MASNGASPARGYPLAMIPVALLSVLAGVLGGPGPVHEGRSYTPYRDAGGVWTVCAGVTGAAIRPSRIYTQAECDRLETTYIQQMFHALGDCVDGTFTEYEVRAWGHFAYNIGTTAFCRSTAARRLNAGERQGACAEISKWVYVHGKDCRQPASNCAGIVARRAWERALCEGRLR